MRLILACAFAVLVLAAIAAAAAAAARRAEGTEAKRLRLGRVDLLLGWSLAILLMTLTARGGETDVKKPLTDLRKVLAHPDEPSLAYAAVGNVVLFAPLGAILALRRWPLARAAVVGGAFSLSIELAQLLVPGRTTAADDVILNTLGTALGWLVASLALRPLLSRS